MCATEDSLLLNGLQRSMISQAASGPGATMSAEGRFHFAAEHTSLASVGQVALACAGWHLQACPRTDECPKTLITNPRFSEIWGSVSYI